MKPIVSLFVVVAFSAAGFVSKTFADSASPSTNPTTSPSPTTAAINVPVKKLAPPTGSALDDATKLVDEVYAEEIANAKGVDQKSALATKLLQAGVDEKNDMAGKFVLLNRSLELSTAAGDLSAASRAIDELGQTFDVDPFAMDATAAVAIWKTMPIAADRKDFATLAQSLADDAAKADQFDSAKELDALALAAARQSKDATLMAEVNADAQGIDSARSEFISIKPALKLLKENAADVEANLAVGRFRCFFKGDWDTGLPMLANGSDAKLKSLADAELKPVAEPAALVAIADGWWDIGSKETGLAKQVILAHAGKLYDDIAPGLTGLSQAKAQKRMQIVAANETHPLPGSYRRIVNLLALVDPTRDTISGSWSMDNGTLVCAHENGPQLAFPYEPPKEFDFNVDFLREDSRWGMSFLFPKNNIMMGWSVSGAQGSSGTFEHFSPPLDDKAIVRAIVCESGRKYSLHIEVRQSSLRAFVDNKLAVYCGPELMSHIVSGFEFWHQTTRIGVGDFWSGVHYSKVEIIERSGTGTYFPANGEKTSQIPAAAIVKR